MLELKIIAPNSCYKDYWIYTDRIKNKQRNFGNKFLMQYVDNKTFLYQRTVGPEILEFRVRGHWDRVLLNFEIVILIVRIL